MSLKFNRLTHIRFVETKLGQAMHEFKCDCGNLVITRMNRVKAGKCKSCGCLSREIARNLLIKMNTRHGYNGTRLYKIWIGIKSRCYDKNKREYKYYGGKRNKYV